MRFFQKKRDAIGNADEWESQPSIPYVDHTPSTANENEYLKNNKQSIGQLVRKLNCSSSKKHDCDNNVDQQRLADGGENDNKHWGEANSETAIVHNSQWKDSVSHPPLRTVTLPEIKRPVLITVKNGNVNEPVPLFNDNNQPKSSRFIVEDLSTPSKMCTSSSFRLGMSARKRRFDTNI